ncbi:MAG: molybdenum cofactor carrier [Gammaproteobacteria bacterium]|nr:molybdenum cofactor carrier [Gammaproteobacteria bacterium]
MGLQKVISGGQTGVDRAALDVALQLGLSCGGWCPKGRLAEDGEIAACYPLQETPSTEYKLRTDWNVLDSDATLILNLGNLEGGTALTQVLARCYGSPCMVLDLELDQSVEQLLAWLEKNSVSTLNVAGPRGSKRPEAYKLATEFLRQLIPLARALSQ